MTHANRGRITAAARSFADSRETSDEVAQAIFNRTSDDAEVQRIWVEPTPSEEKAILAEAWRLADPDEEMLFWGGRHRRP
jgi:hypothetical protein